MSFYKDKGNCFCERCGYAWIASINYQNGKFVYFEPKSCAKCKSKVWNKPRVYSNTKNFSGVCFAQREKPTGRQAAKLRPEIIAEKRRKELIENYLYAVKAYKRTESNFFEMVETGEINDRYERGRKRGQEMQHYLNLASDDITFWIEKLAEFDGIKERGADAYLYYQRNRHLLD